MNKVLLGSLFALLIVITSCSQDENNSEPENQESTIVGTWFLKSISVNGVQDELSDCDLRSNIVFESDGAIVDNEFTEDSQFGCFNDGLSGTYAISGEDITFEFVDGDPEEVVQTVTYSFDLNDNTLALTDSDDGAIYSYTKQ